MMSDLDRYQIILLGDRHIRYDTIRYDMKCYFNVRSKADMSPLNLPHGVCVCVCATCPRLLAESGTVEGRTRDLLSRKSIALTISSPGHTPHGLNAAEHRRWSTHTSCCTQQWTLDAMNCMVKLVGRGRPNVDHRKCCQRCNNATN